MVSWNTVHASPPAKLDDKNQSLLSWIRLGVSSLPESQVMKFSMLGGQSLGLKKEDAVVLNRLLAVRYKKIKEDEIFSETPSALAYCFSEKRPKTGRASVYVPDKLNKDTKVILFIHGYGGSFIFYQHYLAKLFPDHLIICPAYGISGAFISSTYLEECREATAKQLGVEINKPVLMGLSAGGFGGFREYVRRSATYSGFICMAAYPPDGVINKIPRDGKIRLVAGGDELFVKNGKLRRAEIRLKGKIKDFDRTLIPDHGHFFLLSAQEETQKILKKWVLELQR